jgi:inositol 1,4,5-triphosphate receptor type 1
LFSLVLTKEKETPDAFSVRKVPDELVYFVNYISGFIPILHRFSSIRRLRELRPTEAEELAKELNELDGFMYYKGIEQKKRQKLLRSLQVIEALVAMLKAPFANEQRHSETSFGFPSNSSTRDSARAESKRNPGHLLESYDDVTHPRHRNTQIVMVNVFRVLRSFLTGQARKNEMYMAAHMPFLWRLFVRKFSDSITWTTSHTCSSALSRPTHPCLPCGTGCL